MLLKSYIPLRCCLGQTGHTRIEVYDSKQKFGLIQAIYCLKLEISDVLSGRVLRQEPDISMMPPFTARQPNRCAGVIIHVCAARNFCEMILGFDSLTNVATWGPGLCSSAWSGAERESRS